MGGEESSMKEGPEPGDLIEISRGIYTHWALYVGGGNVIHLTVPDGATGVSLSSVPSVHCNRGQVKKQPLSEVVGGGTWRISKKYDAKYNRRPREKILRDAEAMVGKWVDYDLFSNNCEHFATEMRYGVPESKQAVNGLLMTTGTSLAILAAAAVAVVAFDNPKPKQRR